MDSSNCQELELKIQELHTATRTVELLTRNAEFLENENEYLKAALAEEKKLLEEAKKNAGRPRNEELHHQMMEGLKQELEESQASEKTLKAEVQQLQKRLEQVLAESSTANVSARSDFDAEEFVILSNQVAQLEEEKIKLQAELLEVSMKLQQESGEKARLQQEVLEKDDEMECMESQFSTQCSISERLREENQQLKAQLESETGQVDQSRKGNSLFSEVDDRRVAAESKVVQVQQQMQSLEEKLTRETKENKRLKNQIAYLRQTSKKGFDEEAVKALQHQVVQSKKTIAELMENINVLETSQKQNPVIEYQRPSAESTEVDKRYISFLEGLIRTKTKEVNDVRSQAQHKRLECVRTDLQLTQANNEATVLRHEVSQLKLCNSHLTLTLQDLKHKYGEESESESPEKRRHSKKMDGVSTTTTPAAKPAVLTPIENSAGLLSRKENVRLRDLVDVNHPGRSKGVRLDSEVKVVGSGGDQSMVGLREDGNAGKPRRAKGTAKFNSVTYMEEPESEPAQCNQQ